MRKYSIAEISEMTGLSRRTIRYYLQRGLIPSPLGAGRGRYYTEDHLAHLRKIIDLQSRGMFLDEIARQINENSGHKPWIPERVLSRKEQRPLNAMDLSGPSPDSSGTYPDLAEPTMLVDKTAVKETWIKVPLADGVELSIRKDRAMMMDEHLDQIVETIEKILTGSEKGGLPVREKKGELDED